MFSAPTPKARSRVKKLSTEDKKSAPSPRLSPAPVEETVVAKINTGPKELSTAGLTLNTVVQALDKSGRPCRRWAKRPLEFKTFSGFKVGVDIWKRQGENLRENPDAQVPNLENTAVKPAETVTA